MLKKVDVATYETIKTRSATARSPPASRSSTSPSTASATPRRGGFVDDIADQLDAFKEQIVARRDRRPDRSLS